MVFSVDLVFKMRSSVIWFGRSPPCPSTTPMWNNTHTTPLQCPPELIFYAEHNKMVYMPVKRYIIKPWTRFAYKRGKVRIRWAYEMGEGLQIAGGVEATSSKAISFNARRKSPAH